MRLAKFGLIAVLLSLLFGGCPIDRCSWVNTVPVDVSFDVTPATITETFGIAVLTVTISPAYSKDITLVVDTRQGPLWAPIPVTLSADAITIPAGQTQGTVTLTVGALPTGVAETWIGLDVGEILPGNCGGIYLASGTLHVVRY